MNDPDNEHISVLLIDDDEDDYVIIKQVFSLIPESPFVLEWCSSCDTAKKLIRANAHDVYLVDYNLGMFSGLDLLKFANQQNRSEPFIMLTGTDDRQTQKQSMQLGAADYLVKGTFTAELLSRTLLYSLGRKQIEEQKINDLLELNRVKDEFISLASHQLRTPATAVKQYVGMVLEGFVGDISDAQRKLLTSAYESNERQLRIVSDLLKVAQVDAGKVRLRNTDTDLSLMIRDVIKEQQQTYKDRRQKVRVTHPSVHVNAFVDADRIRMVAENLLDNASKYSAHATTITASLAKTADEVTISIKDHGVGIASRDIDKLFGKFSRIYNPLSAQVGGTGLGLYWAQKIVNLHGGSITVDSQENKGTTFVIHLPNKR